MDPFYQYNQKKRSGSLRYTFLGIFVGLLLIVAMVEGYAAYKIWNLPLSSNVLSEQVPQPSSDPALTMPQKPGLQTFVSQKYSYGFYYQSYTTNSNGSRSNLTVSEQSDGMLVAYTDQSKTPFRIAEVFAKDTNQSLDDAIKEKILQGKSPANCALDDASFDDANLPANLEHAKLKSQAQQAATPSATPAVCPPAYVQSNNANPRFFLMDKSHPMLFLFVNQDANFALPATDSFGKTVNWFDTLTFLR